MHHRKRKPSVNQPVDQEPLDKDTTTAHEAEKKLEELPSVEWGERLNSGKAIARGGKTTGHVPGASPAHPM